MVGNMKSSGMMLSVLGMCCCLCEMATGFHLDAVLRQTNRGYGDRQRAIKRSLTGGFGVGAGGGGGPGGLGGYDDTFVEIRQAPAKRIEAREHGKIVLECSADGSPAPHITWLKDGKPFFKDGKKRHVQYPLGSGKSGPKVMQATGEVKSKITLDCLSEADAGVYECVASNGHAKQAVEATTVSVVSFQGTSGHCKNSLFGGWEDDAGAEPVIHQWMDTYTQLVGQDALLTCRAAGNHETFWYFEPLMNPDDRKMIDLKSDKYQMTATGDLVVRDLSYTDMGHYLCNVRNLNGEDSVKTFVYPLAAM